MPDIMTTLLVEQFWPAFTEMEKMEGYLTLVHHKDFRLAAQVELQ